MALDKDENEIKDSNLVVSIGTEDDNPSLVISDGIIRVEFSESCELDLVKSSPDWVKYFEVRTSQPYLEVKSIHNNRVIFNRVE